MTELHSVPLAPGSDRVSAGTFVWIAVALLAPTAMLLLFVSNGAMSIPGVKQQGTALGVALFFGVVALFSRRRGTLSLIVFGAAVLVIAAVLWNRVYLMSYDATRPPGDIYRPSLCNLHAPLYGAPAVYCRAWAIVPPILGIGLICALYRVRALLESRQVLWVLIVFQIAMTVFIALADRDIRLTDDFAAYARYSGDAQRFTGVGDLFTRYVQTMPTLGNYGKHYPPGTALLFVCQRTWDLSMLVKTITLVLSALAVVPIYGLAMELGLSRMAGGLAAALFATSPSVLYFPTISPTPGMMFFAAGAIWMLVRAVRRDDIVAGCLMGVAMAIYVVFSFAAYMVAVLMAIFAVLAVLRREAPLGRVIKVIGAGLGVFVAFFGLLNVMSGFDIVACFAAASRGHIDQTGHGFDSVGNYLLRASGSLIAYLIAAGFPMSILGIAAVGGARREGGCVRWFIYAAAGAVLFAAFNTMAFLETERIWLVFSPALAILAGYELHRRSEREGAATRIVPIALAVLIACATIVVYQPHTFGEIRTRHHAKPIADRGLRVAD